MPLLAMLFFSKEATKSRLQLTVSDNKILRNKIADLEAQVANHTEVGRCI